MATIDLKLKSYDELIFEITKLNTDKYLLEQENKQLKEEIDKLLSHVVGMSYNTEKALELTQKINNNLKEEMK